MALQRPQNGARVCSTEPRSTLKFGNFGNAPYAMPALMVAAAADGRWCGSGGFWSFGAAFYF